MSNSRLLVAKRYENDTNYALWHLLQQHYDIKYVNLVGHADAIIIGTPNVALFLLNEVEVLTVNLPQSDLHDRLHEFFKTYKTTIVFYTPTVDAGMTYFQDYIRPSYDPFNVAFFATPEQCASLIRQLSMVNTPEKKERFEQETALLRKQLIEMDIYSNIMRSIGINDSHIAIIQKHYPSIFDLCSASVDDIQSNIASKDPEIVNKLRLFLDSYIGACPNLLYQPESSDSPPSLERPSPISMAGSCGELSEKHHHHQQSIQQGGSPQTSASATYAEYPSPSTSKFIDGMTTRMSPSIKIEDYPSSGTIQIQHDLRINPQYPCTHSNDVIGLTRIDASSSSPFSFDDMNHHGTRGRYAVHAQGGSAPHAQPCQSSTASSYYSSYSPPDPSSARGFIPTKLESIGTEYQPRFPSEHPTAFHQIGPGKRYIPPLPHGGYEQYDEQYPQNPQGIGGGSSGSYPWDQQTSSLGYSQHNMHERLQPLQRFMHHGLRKKVRPNQPYPVGHTPFVQLGRFHPTPFDGGGPQQSAYPHFSTAENLHTHQYRHNHDSGVFQYHGAGGTDPAIQRSNTIYSSSSEFDIHRRDGVLPNQFVSPPYSHQYGRDTTRHHHPPQPPPAPVASKNTRYSFTTSSSTVDQQVFPFLDDTSSIMADESIHFKYMDSHRGEGIPIAEFSSRPTSFAPPSSFNAPFH